MKEQTNKIGILSAVRVTAPVSKPIFGWVSLIYKSYISEFVEEIGLIWSSTWRQLKIFDSSIQNYAGNYALFDFNIL